MSSCCPPGRDGPASAEPFASAGSIAAGTAATSTLLSLPGGRFRMGSEDPDVNAGDGEGPVRVVDMAAFRIDALTVTNERFTDFVDATGYVTEAEQFGWSFVFDMLVAPEVNETIDRVVAGTPWWLPVPGANWRAPEGAGSGIENRGDHPVVHVSWRDAMAYCEWAGVRLPTEPEWEYAARGGLDQARFPWGDELEPGGRHMCNIWQGDFPTSNTLADGYLATAPANAFEPNGFGLYNVSGNVWEWTADSFRGTLGGGPAMRGGSYLCHVSYCNRYRVAARTSNTADSSAGNIGFRVAADA